MSADGGLVATVLIDGTVRILAGLTTKQCAASHAHRPAESRTVSTLAFKDATTLATGADGEGGPVRIWDLETGKPTQTLPHRTGASRPWSFPPMDERLATASAEGNGHALGADHRSLHPAARTTDRQARTTPVHRGRTHARRGFFRTAGSVTGGRPRRRTYPAIFRCWLRARSPGDPAVAYYARARPGPMRCVSNARATRRGRRSFGTRPARRPASRRRRNSPASPPELRLTPMKRRPLCGRPMA